MGGGCWEEESCLEVMSADEQEIGWVKMGRLRHGWCWTTILPTRDRKGEGSDIARYVNDKMIYEIYMNIIGMEFHMFVIPSRGQAVKTQSSNQHRETYHHIIHNTSIPNNPLRSKLLQTYHPPSCIPLFSLETLHDCLYRTHVSQLYPLYKTIASGTLSSSFILQSVTNSALQRHPNIDIEPTTMLDTIP